MRIDHRDPNVTEEQLRIELAAVYRLIAHFRMTDLVFTHISVRLPDVEGQPEQFLINPYGLLFEEITASNLVRINSEGELIGESEHPVNPAGFVIHSAVHAAREDAKCVLHTHTLPGCAVAATAEGLLPLNQISMEFYNRVGYHEYEGVALNLDEQKRLVEDLGGNDALILRNHGLLTVGETPAKAFLRMYYLNKACEIQVAAARMGELVIPEPEVAEHVAQQLAGSADGDDFTDDIGSDLAWSALVRMLDRTQPDYRD
ncbi:class II aldolase/adducin family protein [Millisia brevis]|uniref:class II aldolase/adducin family protein n=1 Tax=Millisia brevis TaxID=264148 RepID=UPI00082DB458|nr:class II aldolase/adducin family protein [Millisia brevis]